MVNNSNRSNFPTYGSKDGSGSEEEAKVFAPECGRFGGELALLCAVEFPCVFGLGGEVKDPFLVELALVRLLLCMI